MSNQNLMIEFNKKKYTFSTRSLVLYPIGSFILAVLLILFFELPINIWLHEIIARQSAFFINLLFSLGAEVEQNSNVIYPWIIRIPESITVTMSSGCAGIHAISIFVSIIIFIPHSKDPKTSENIIWRKTVDIILTSTFIYIFNIFRIVVIVYLYHLGYDWFMIHDSLANLSAVIAVHVFIFLFCNKLVPEWYISLYYTGKILFSHLKLKIRKKS